MTSFIERDTMMVIKCTIKDPQGDWESIRTSPTSVNFLSQASISSFSSIKLSKSFLSWCFLDFSHQTPLQARMAYLDAINL